MNRPPVFIISGGTGASGAQIVRTALAQFQNANVPVHILPEVRQMSQLIAAVDTVKASQGIIVHTLVDTTLRHLLIQMARDRNIVAVDLMDQLLSHLAEVLEQEPLNHPGLYHQLHQDYFDRIAAIEFTVAHDDGRNLSDLHLAEIILVGVSRVGKTPLSIYLSTRGWKVANIPLVKDIDLPQSLFEIDSRRVVALMIEPGQLLVHRQTRQRHLGVSTKSDYIDPAEIYEELESARRLFRRSGFHIVNITDKPIEETAEEVLGVIGQSRVSPRIVSDNSV